jgi:hypothetical protein
LRRLTEIEDAYETECPERATAPEPPRAPKRTADGMWAHGGMDVYAQQQQQGAAMHNGYAMYQQHPAKMARHAGVPQAPPYRAGVYAPQQQQQPYAGYYQQQPQAAYGGYAPPPAGHYYAQH